MFNKRETILCEYFTCYTIHFSNTNTKYDSDIFVRVYIIEYIQHTFKNCEDKKTCFILYYIK